MFCVHMENEFRRSAIWCEAITIITIYNANIFFVTICVKNINENA